METLYPSTTKWSKEENKRFESALAIYDEESPDRWLKVAAMIPGKTVGDVIKQFRELEEDVSEIEAGRFPIRHFDVYGRKSFVGRGFDHERKKGVPWTEEEHKQFLRGLLKYGKGDWRNISRNFVNSKTPTQVASHAQKYFMRQLSGGKDKRRPSIHDITTVNLAEPTTSVNRSSHGGLLGLGPYYGDCLVSYPSGTATNGIKNEQDRELNDAYYGTYSKPHTSIFHFESSGCQIYG